MSWFNGYGLAFFVVLMIPNILASMKYKESFENHFDCKWLLFAEQVGRFGAFLLLVFNIPFTYVGFFFPSAEAVYLAVNGALLLAYVLVWVVVPSRAGLARAILLSVIPSVMFLFSGVMIISIPLLFFSLLFAVCHVIVSVKNAGYFEKNEKD